LLLCSKLLYLFVNENFPLYVFNFDKFKDDVLLNALLILDDGPITGVDFMLYV